MAVPKDKVLAAIELKFKGKSLTKNFKDKIAEKWAAKIETEEDIDAYIEDREDVILEASTEADRRATQAADKARKEAAEAAAGKKPDGEGNQSQQEPEPDTEIGKLMKMVTSLTQTVSTLQQERQSQSIADRFKKDERLKGIPEALLKGRIPQKEEDFEAAITEAVTDLKPIAESLKLTDFGKDAPAGGGRTQTAGSVKEASKEELDAAFANL